MALRLGRPCIICDKQIEPSEHNGYQNGAVHCVVRVGFGSQHDLTQLDFVICDECITVRIFGYGCSIFTKWHDPFTGELFDTEEELDAYHLKNTRELFRKNPELLDSLKQQIAESPKQQVVGPREVKTNFFDVGVVWWRCPHCEKHRQCKENEVYPGVRVKCPCGEYVTLNRQADEPSPTRTIRTAFYDVHDVWHCPHCGQRWEENAIHEGKQVECSCGEDVILQPKIEEAPKRTHMSKDPIYDVGIVRWRCPYCGEHHVCKENEIPDDGARVECSCGRDVILQPQVDDQPERTRMTKTAFYDAEYLWYCPHCGLKHGCIESVCNPRNGVSGVRMECACGKYVILEPHEHSY